MEEDPTPAESRLDKKQRGVELDKGSNTQKTKKEPTLGYETGLLPSWKGEKIQHLP